MREIRRKDRVMDKDKAYKLLENAEYAVMAMISSDDNNPYCIPISPVVLGNYIYIHSAMEGLKVESINKNPNVCITCIGNTRLVPENFTTEYESVVVRGIAQFVKDKDEKIQALRLICEKFATSNMKNFQKAINASLHRTNIIKIEIRDITGKCKKVNRN